MRPRVHRPVSLDLARRHVAGLRRTRLAETAASWPSHSTWPVSTILSAVSHSRWRAMAILSVAVRYQRHVEEMSSRSSAGATARA
jgi:hypothetical protein